MTTTAYVVTFQHFGDNDSYHAFVTMNRESIVRNIARFVLEIEYEDVPDAPSIEEIMAEVKETSPTETTHFPTYRWDDIVFEVDPTVVW